jgi:hypothetical protein
LPNRCIKKKPPGRGPVVPFLNDISGLLLAAQ